MNNLDTYGFVAEHKHCIACGNNYMFNGYEPLTPCPHCEKIKAETRRLLHKFKRKGVKIRRGGLR